MQNKYLKRFYKILILFFAILPFCFAMSDLVKAADGLADYYHEHGGWAPNGLNDGGIYDNIIEQWIADGTVSGSGVTADDVVDAFKNNAEDSITDGDIDNYIFNALTGVIGTVAYSVGKTLQAFGMGLSNIIYGRVLGYGSYDLSGLIIGEPHQANGFETTFFHFELVQGNVYGYIGALLYAGIRVLAIVGITCVFLSRLGVCMFRRTGDAREELKSATVNAVLMMFLLYLMPYFVDLMIYVRNVLLYGIGSFSLKTFGTYDLLDAFLGAYADADKLNIWVFDLGMLGVVGITIYFAFKYVSNAMGTMLMFVIFPFESMMSSFDKNAVRNWLREMIGYLLVPVIDAFLFLIPVIVGHVAETQIIIQVISIGMIIPARQAVRGMLGMSSSSGIDRVGAFGAMAAISAVKTVASTVAKVFGTVASGGASQLAGKMGGAMAGAKGEGLMSAKEQMMGINGFGGSNVTRLPFDMDSEQRERTQPALDQYNALMATGKADDMAKAKVLRQEKLSEVEEYLKPKSSVSEREKDRQEGAAKVDALTGSDNLGIGANNEEIRKLAEKNRELNSTNSNLKLTNANINAAIEAGITERTVGKSQIADNNVLIAENDKEIRANSDKISRYQEQNKLYEESVRGYRNQYGKDGISEDKKNEIEMRFANAMNFDSGAFKSLTDEQKSAFYAQKALMEHQRSLGLGIGGAAGAALGFGGTMFMDSSAKLGAVTIGSTLGAELGGAFMGRMPVSNNISYAPSFATSGGNFNMNIPVASTALSVSNPNIPRYASSMPVDAEFANRVGQSLVSQLNIKNLKPSGLSENQINVICKEVANSVRSNQSTVAPIVNYFVNDKKFCDNFR